MTTVRGWVAAALAWSVAAGVSSQASPAPQDDTPPAETPASAEAAGLLEHPMVTRAQRWMDALHARGIYPDAGTIISGSGVAFGSGFRSPTWGRSGVAIEVAGMWSVRGYQAYAMQAGLLTRRRRTLALRPADAEIGRTFDLPATARTGVSVYLEARHQSYPQMDYFGVDPEAADVRADFALTGSSADLVAQWQQSPAFGVSARIGVLDLDVGPGRNSRLPNVAEVFDAITAPGLNDRPKYQVSAAGLAIDRRDHPHVPTGGVFVGVAAGYYRAIGPELTSLARVAVDGRVFHAIAAGHVIALNVLASADRTPGSAPTPFYLQSWIGGSRTLRGLPNYRLRGESLAHLAVEYRWRAARFVEIAPFVDVGAVSATGHDLRDGPLHASVGAGLRLRSDDRTLVRLDWGTSEGRHRVVLSLSPSF